MKRKFFWLAMVFVAAGYMSCKKSTDKTTPPPNPPPTSDTLTLRYAAAFPVGVGIDYTPMKNDATYASIVKTQFSNVTFGYNMKHGAIVQDDGSFNFNTADELYNIVNTAGLTVYGHTLAWHQNNNGNYLRSLLTASVTGGPTLIQNGGFENGAGSSFTNWFTQVTGTGVATFSAETSDVEEGSRALKVIVTTPAANAYQIQAVNDAWTATSGHLYSISFYAKALAGSGTMKVVSQGTTYYEEKIITPGTSYTKYTFNVTPTETAPQVKFHFPSAGTFYVDNVTVTDPSAGTAPSPDVIKARIDTALKTWVATIVTHYKGKVYAWDAVNETINDGTGTLRNNPTPGTTTGDAFYWSEYLGRGYVAKVFNYAHAADPNVPLFINDYNLESDNVKLDSLIGLVNELKTQGVPISGIGVQMHISINNNKSAIDLCFQKLANTGLKIRVSEMDVRINPNNVPGFAGTGDLFNQQADMYNYVANSYMRNVPKAQQFGFTIWGISDKDSWIVTTLNKVDFPLLFDNNYQKKPAFNKLRDGLQGK